jgi:hypothetical protein
MDVWCAYSLPWVIVTLVTDWLGIRAWAGRVGVVFAFAAVVLGIAANFASLFLPRHREQPRYIHIDFAR